MTEIGGTISHYQILEKLGEGGMGIVYKARDDRLSRFVAIKVLPPEKVADSERRARFAREARAASALNHPNIVTIHDIDSPEGGECIVMEYIAGKSLAAGIEAGNLRLPDVLRYGTQIAEALAAAHDAGIIHRDLKPTNIMVTESGLIKVLDFGLAKLTEVPASSGGETATLPTTGVGTIVGTVGYMSPEQVRGQALDRRSDIFNLGLVLYEMLADGRAFRGDSAIEVMNAILKEAPADLPEKVPAALRQIVAACLEKNPANRFESARDIAFALRALSAGSGSMTAMQQSTTSASVRRRVSLPVYAALAAAVILAGVFAALYFTRRPERLDLSSYRYTPFATEAEYETNGVWSPDGRSIAYLKRIGGSNQLMVRGLDAPSPTQLTSLPGGINHIAYWSHDGNRIHFIAEWNLWSVSLAGENPQQVLPSSDIRTATLSPDGNTLALVRFAPMDGKQTRSVWISSPPGSEPRRYLPDDFAEDVDTKPNYLKFSHDGALIAFANYSSSGVDFWLLDWPDGENAKPRRIFQKESFIAPPAFAWLPDPRRMVLSTGGSLWLADTTTDTLSRLTASIGTMEVLASLSPEGKSVVVDSQTSDYDIVSIPIDTTGFTPIFATARNEHYPSLPGSGEKIAFITDRSGESEIWLRSTYGDWERPIVTKRNFPDQSEIGFHYAAISPDGFKVAFRTNPQAKLYIVPTAGGSPFQIMPGIDQREFSFSWSPESDSLACFLSKDGSKYLAIVELGSPNSPHYIGTESLVTAPAWSPDGNWIAYGSSSKGGSMALVSPDGKRSKEFPSPVTPSSQQYVLIWSRDSSTIYVASSLTGKARLDAVDVKTGMSTEIATYGSEIDFQTPFNMGLSGYLTADGKSFVTTVLNSKSDLWILEGFPIPRR